MAPWAILYPWDSPGQNPGVGNLFLLQGLSPTQELNPGLPHCRRILYQLSHKGSPRILEWDLPDPGVKPGSPALQVDSLPTELSGKPIETKVSIIEAFLPRTVSVREPEKSVLKFNFFRFGHTCFYIILINHELTESLVKHILTHDIVPCTVIQFQHLLWEDLMVLSLSYSKISHKCSYTSSPWARLYCFGRYCFLEKWMNHKDTINCILSLE